MTLQPKVKNATVLDERHLCFYFDPLKIIYIYKKEDGQLLNHVMIKDKAQFFSLHHLQLDYNNQLHK